MPFKRRVSADTGIDVSSFSDIAFLLIIFFILTTTFVATAGRKMQVPSGTNVPSESEQKQLTINLTPGTIQYGEDSRHMSMDELRLALAAEKFSTVKAEQRMVILDSKDDVAYERYYQVVMAITEANGVLALVDEKEEK